MNAYFLRFLLAFLLVGGVAAADQTVLVVVGAAGAEEYGEQFRQWADRWAQAAQRGGANLVRIGEGDLNPSDRDELAAQITLASKEENDPLWLVLIGHGTYDGKAAKFNLRGPDVSATELAVWLKPCDRPLVVVNCASSSGPFVQKLSEPRRVIVTATRSGIEHNFARFGDYLSTAIGDPSADLDKDQQTSILEAYLSAASQTEAFYAEDGRLATEHALLDDNGDGLATPASWFRGVRAVKKPKEGAEPDGFRANQFHLIRNPAEQNLAADKRRMRDELEQAIETLRQQKASLKEEDYYRRLEAILIPLAKLHEESE